MTKILDETVDTLTEGLDVAQRASTLTPARLAESLPSTPDLLLYDLRRAAALLGAPHWRTLVAIDYEIVRRASVRRHAQGRRDAGGGHRHRLLPAARLLRVERRLLFRNARIHELSRGATTVFVHTHKGELALSSILTEYSHYDAALRFDDPLEALLTFSTRVAADLPLRIADLKPPRLPAMRVENRVEGCDACAITLHIQKTLRLFKEEIIKDCPSKEWQHRLYLDFIEDLNFTLDSVADKHEHVVREEGK